MAKSSSIIECMICMEPPRLAVETDCCGQIFCQICLEAVNTKVCPHCRKAGVTFHPNCGLRRVLEEKGTPCPNDCGSNLSLVELLKHLQICTKAYTCPGPECEGVFGDLNQFLMHIVHKHGAEAADRAHLLFQQTKTSDCQTDPIHYPKWHDQTYDPADAVLNEARRRARLGANGKYYCGATIEYFCKLHGGKNCGSADCICCVRGISTCGPNKGCNCDPCQRLDLQLRGIDAKGWLVSPCGALAKFVPKDKQNYYYEGMFICGRRALDADEHKQLDLYCGYTSQKSCKECRTLLEHVRNGQYKNFMEAKLN